MDNREFLVVQNQFTMNEFELVNEIPIGYTIWNVGYISNGGYMIDGYLPLCRLKQIQPFEGGREIETDTLKAIKVDGADKIMDAFIRGFTSVDKMESYVKRHRNSRNKSVLKRIAICNAAIPVMRSLNWEGER